MWLLDKALSRLIKQGTLTLVTAKGERTVYGRAEPGWPDLVMRLTDDKVAGYIARHPRLGMAEAYIDGRVVVEGGDIMDFIAFVRRNNPWEQGRDLDRPSRTGRLVKRASNRLQQLNQRAASKRNVAHHYDLGNDFYRLFLDEHWQYSCAYWDDGVTDLAEAQEAKLAHIAAKLKLEPGMRVLDIGCGWGGMARYLHDKAGVEVLGVTLSEEQIAYAKARAEADGVADRVRFELRDYRDVEGSFDRIVSVGMFEHVGAPNFGEFFRTCHNLLAPDGVMLLHTIGRTGGPGATDTFTQKYIFPGGYIPALSETVAASEPARLMLSDVEILRVHYARTLRAWYANCVANKDAIVAMYDEKFYRLWTFYLSGATAAFEYGGMVNFQLQYVRDRHTLPLTRDYMAEGETSLRG
ncbi:class I SAM-dependent methyltransferase [Sphingorhabdus soli]|uniref:Class I SAM-dependent methyltransferase n=1 Tax=Flavisphingopyxis soli TaxID=2601267 RepID=A0A5C6UMC0_9SPHN|nr:cyclopropane-fatty-acyl-phospholipid synthase family protein [Sphingorhabdus soli]TXC74412.1 class I SAM-dependent methyltransferase [Sphingorhabdus soli]